MSLPYAPGSVTSRQAAESIVCVLQGPEVVVALRAFRDSDQRLGGASFQDSRGGGIPFPTWIDWTGFPDGSNK